MNKELSLYIHIPFCAGKCDYCDFYSQKISRRGTVEPSVRAQGIKREFLDVLVKDINEQVEIFNVRSIPTVYIGGGTPSVLGKDIKILLDALKKIPAFKAQEFTVEANPESLTEEFLAVCREGGVNRLSLGIQTFFEPSRKAVNRMGDAALLEDSLALASRFFPGAVSADLITGFPFHTKEIVKEDIKRLLEHDPAHVSVYSLTTEKETLLYRKLKNGSLILPDKDLSDDLWLASKDMLLEAGFLHYEVSNFARRDKMCIHNIRYWRMESWLGAGPSASGTVIDQKAGTAMRYTYPADVKAYIEQNALSKEQTSISKDQLLREIILMGYRYYEGPDRKWDADKLIPETLQKWKDRDIMLFLNSFLKDAFIELEDQVTGSK